MLFYWYPKCSTCQKARAFLQELGLTFKERHIVEEQPSLEELRDLYRRSDLELKRFFNTSGKLYRELNLTEKRASMTEEEQLALLASNGMLVKRPILDTGDRVLVGFREAEYRSLVK